MADRRSCNQGGRACHHKPDATQTLVGPKPKYELFDRRVGGQTLPVLHGVDEARSRHHVEPLVDTDKELGWNHSALDRAELRAFDLPRDRAQLARVINFSLDPAARIPLDRGSIVLGELVGRIVYGRKSYLHHKNL